MADSTLTQASFAGNGAVVFRKEVPARPETRRTSGSVTFHDPAIAGVPSHYEATFMINADYEANGVVTSNVFHWSCAVVHGEKSAPYDAIEDQAARQVPAMLRSLADALEADIEAAAAGASS